MQEGRPEKEAVEGRGWSGARRGGPASGWAALSADAADSDDNDNDDDDNDDFDATDSVDPVDDWAARRRRPDGMLPVFQPGPWDRDRHLRDRPLKEPGPALIVVVYVAAAVRLVGGMCRCAAVELRRRSSCVSGRGA